MYVWGIAWEVTDLLGCCFNFHLSHWFFLGPYSLDILMRLVLLVAPPMPTTPWRHISAEPRSGFSGWQGRPKNLDDLNWKRSETRIRSSLAFWQQKNHLNIETRAESIRDVLKFATYVQDLECQSGFWVIQMQQQFNLVYSKFTIFIHLQDDLIPSNMSSPWAEGPAAVSWHLNQTRSWGGIFEKASRLHISRGKKPNSPRGTSVFEGLPWEKNISTMGLLGRDQASSIDKTHRPSSASFL